MTKVIFIITKLELGGAQKVCLELFYGLVSMKATSQIITSPGGFLDDQIRPSDNASFIEGLSNSLSPLGLWRNLKAIFKIYKLLRQEVKKDNNVIVHTHSSAAGVIGRLAAQAAGVKNIVHTVHGFPFNDHQGRLKQLALKTVEKICSAISTKLIFVSSKDLTLAVQTLNIARTKCVLIRACVGHEIANLPTKPKRSETITTIGTVACFKPQKNLIDLLEVFKIVWQQNPYLKLLIVGDGQQRPMLEKFIADNELSTVVLLGWVKDLNDFYNTIDIFALTSLWEGLPCAVVEALVREIPVIAYDAGGIGEVVKNGQNGFVVPSLDKKQFVEKLQFLIDNKVALKTTLDTKKLKAEFSVSRMIKKHASLYRSIIG